MKKRPLMFITISSSIAALLGPYINIWILLSVILLFSSTILVSQTGLKSVRSILTVFVPFIMFLVYSYLTFQATPYSLIFLENKTTNFKVKVDSIPDIKQEKAKYFVMLLEANSEKVQQNRLLMTVYNKDGKHTFSIGDELIVLGTVTLAPPSKNDGGFDYRLYLKSQKCEALLYAYDTKLVSTSKNPITTFFNHIRKKTIGIIDNTLPQEEAGLLKGMLIGEKNSLRPETQQDFTISGLTHILCVSGANIAYIAFASLFVLGFLNIGKSMTNIITIIIIIVFTCVVGLSPPVLRASAMGITLLSAQLFSRKSDTLTSISTACLLLLVVNPLTIFDVGFQLSFLGTIGIVILYKPLLSFFKFFPDKMNNLFSITLAAQIMVCPLTAYYFNKVSLVSLISNIVVVPLTGIVTIIGFITVVSGQICEFIAALFSGLNYFFLSLILLLTKIFSALPFASINTYVPGIAFLVLYYSAVWLFLIYIPKHKPNKTFYKKAIFSYSMVCVVSVVFMLLPSSLTIDFIDIGQGDSILIKTPEKQTCLIDGGGSYPGTTSTYNPSDTLIPFLYENDVSNIDVVVLSHPHGDHIQGLFDILKTFRVKILITSPQSSLSEEFKKLSSLCTEKGTKLIFLSSGGSFSLGNSKFIALFPHGQSSNPEISENNGSLVLQFSYNNVKILFTGDIEEIAEKEILNSKIDIDSDILKVSHHGSKTSSSAEFIEAVSPKAAIISVGKNNFGHPSKTVLKRLFDFKVPVFRTDINGQIRVIIDKKGFSIFPHLIPNIYE